jgi:small subunit ribosomal protein S9|tara:strand:+ start:4748 stop:5143 length:396 start_codon:yes stop_codon:yes gene_type:complete
MSKKNNFQATGRRKTSVARINLVKGKGNILINGRSVDDYFGRDSTKMVMMQPLELTSSQKSFNININVCGGGTNGQAGAIRHGLARVLQKVDPDLHLTLKQAGMLTRDSRQVERKKYGQPGARKKFQFSKR